MPEMPVALHAARTLLGVGTTGAAGAIGGNKPTGKPVENGGKSCMKMLMVWKLGSAKDPQMIWCSLEPW